MKPFKDRLADGEAAAFELLYEQCSGGLFRFLVSKTGSDHLAADVLQETFLRAVRFRDRLRDVNSLEAWLFTIARREADRLLARRKRTGHTDLACGSDGHKVAARTKTELDDRDEIEAAFTELTDADREILEMHFYGGLTFREIAEVTETPQGTVATRYRSAMARLRKRMDPVSATTVDATRETKQ